MVSKIIGVMIMLVIGLALLPVVSDFANTLTTAGDPVGPPIVEQGVFYGTTTGSLINILPIIYVIILLAGAVGYIVTSRK
ncbi:MAG: hypothetical protein M0R03_17065 [Novosphingobium sp.]|nr:hypothetical protein [Novosphingobium sp.]